jgi:hypothetical protein
MIPPKKTRSAITSADDTAIGFEYQYYYFIYSLLNIKEGEIVGLEVKEDVHIDKADGTTILSQLKHTIDPSSTNLTELDEDLWKTLYNWVHLIIEQSDDEDTSEGKEKKQIEYCQNTEFILITNKALGVRNEIVRSILEFKLNSIDSNQFREKVKKLKGKTTSPEIKEYIEHVLSLTQNVFELFFKRTKIETGVDNLLFKIHKRLRDMMIKKSRVDSVLKVLDGALRQANFSKVKNREKVTLNYEEFHKDYEIYFEIGRTDELIIEDYSCDIDNPLEQQFIQQLIDIQDIFEDDTDDIIVYTEHRLMAFNNLMKWLQDGQITELHLGAFNKEATSVWRNAFKSAHRSIKGSTNTIPLFNNSGAPANLIDMAQSCLYEVRKMELTIRGQQLGIQLSNGQFYSLSNSRKIGWLLDWQTKYGSV